MSGLMYMVTSSIEFSGMGKRYSTALEAGVGGVEATMEYIGTRGAATWINNANFNFATNPNIPAACLTAKLTSPTGSWGPANGCSNSVTIDPNDNKSYDMTITLGSYTVYAKIVDTVQGNTAPVTHLIKTGVVSQNNNEVQVQAEPFLYTIEAVSQSNANPPERSKVSAVYQY